MVLWIPQQLPRLVLLAEAVSVDAIRRCLVVRCVRGKNRQLNSKLKGFVLILSMLEAFNEYAVTVLQPLEADH